MHEKVARWRAAVGFSAAWVFVALLVLPASCAHTAREPQPETTVAAAASLDIGAWRTFVEEGGTATIAAGSSAALLWSLNTGPRRAAVLTRDWSTLADADGLDAEIVCDRDAFLLLSVAEADGSLYGIVLPMEAGVPVDFQAEFDGFGLDENSQDENGRLDVSQLVSVSMTDLSSYLSAPTPRVFSIGRIEVLRGETRPVDWTRGASGPSAASRPFRIGVDANYVLAAEEAGVAFYDGDDRADPIALLAAAGADAFRVRLWVGESGESRLAYAVETARRALAAGMRLCVGVFLADGWADVNGQPAPEAWASLSIDGRAIAIGEYCRDVALRFQTEGLPVDIWEIGNEIDYGICGVFADTASPRDAVSLRASVWPDEARLVAAAAEGLRSVDGEARVMLHIASGWKPRFAVSFFNAMTEFGVDYDYAGLSIYPSAFGTPATEFFVDTLNAIRAEVGKPVIIPETAYPAETPASGMFGSWRRSLPGLPLTPDGQAAWLSGFLSGLRARGDVAGVYVFSPEFWYSGELWGAFALFDSEGRARPAMDAFAPVQQL